MACWGLGDELLDPGRGLVPARRLVRRAAGSACEVALVDLAGDDAWSRCWRRAPSPPRSATSSGRSCWRWPAAIGWWCRAALPRRRRRPASSTPSCWRCSRCPPPTATRSRRSAPGRRAGLPPRSAGLAARRSSRSSSTRWTSRSSASPSPTSRSTGASRTAWPSWSAAACVVGGIVGARQALASARPPAAVPRRPGRPRRRPPAGALALRLRARDHRRAGHPAAGRSSVSPPARPARSFWTRLQARILGLRPGQPGTTAAVVGYLSMPARPGPARRRRGWPTGSASARRSAVYVVVAPSARCVTARCGRGGPRAMPGQPLGRWPPTGSSVIPPSTMR